MKLKYQTEIDKLNPSFEGYGEVDNKTAYRWVFEDINHINNFLPVTKTNPGRTYNLFTCWALSFFISQTHSKERLLHITKDKPLLSKKLGTHVAEGTINLTDGLCEEAIDEHGHFNHFEYDGIDFAPAFTIVEKVA